MLALTASRNAFALLSLPNHKYQQLTQWLAKGEKMPTAIASTKTELVMVEQCEVFLKGD
jgi:hypothetical protein